MSAAAITLEGVGFRRGARSVLAGVALRVAAGERVALLGPSGSGKSSLLRLVLGLERPDEGSVRLGERVASERGRLLLTPDQRNLAVVFQDLALWPHLTVHGNLAFALEAHGMPRPERRARIDALLERLGLRGKADHHPGELSGGERQRVAIARALVSDPCAILLDEPLASLDVQLRGELLALFRELFGERRSTVLYVTHDLREAAALGERMVVLEDGRITQDARLAELCARPSTPFVRALVEDFGSR